MSLRCRNSSLSWKSMVKGVVPPLLIDGVRRLRRSGIRFDGEYSTWAEACAAAQGYADADILDRVREASLQVKRGEACFERDGVVFHEHQPAFPLLTALLDAAVANDGQLRVLDFGGALGGTYYQARPYLQSLKKLEWCVVEQPHYVECGRREFQTDELHFYSSIEECAQSGRPHLALFSGVLQYLPDPQAILHEVNMAEIDNIVIDRTPYLCEDDTRLSVQRVPSALGGASYPLWLFGRSFFSGTIGSTYRCMFDFPALDGRLGQGRNVADFMGYYFVRGSK